MSQGSLEVIMDLRHRGLVVVRSSRAELVLRLLAMRLESMRLAVIVAVEGVQRSVLSLLH